MAKPEIPKRLAARIRAAQNRVDQARENIFYDADELIQLLSRITEFETDAVAFANKHYRGLAPESYPVQTNIERARESVARKRNRQLSQIDVLALADEQLLAVETEVMVEVTAMKPTPGRVRWPRALPSFERAKVAFELGRERGRTQDAIDHQKHLAAVERDYERQMATIERAIKRDDDAEARRWARLLPDQKEAEREEMRPWREALKRGEITIRDTLAGTARIKQ